jgi:MFS family permease
LKRVLWPLLATLALQTLATMAAYSLPASAPAVARDLGIDATLIGFFISTVYGVGILSATLSPGFIHRFGAVRVGQAVLVATLVMLSTAASDGVAGIALGAVLLGLAYGATAPVSTHLLVPRTPAGAINLVLSIRQIGVPLGGVLGGLLVPPLVLAYGWRPALLAQLLPVVLLLVLLEYVRPRWDADRDPARPLFQGGALRPFALLRENMALRRLCLAGFVYSGMQLSVVAFMTVHLTSVAGFDLMHAGQALAAYQIAGVVSRPIWGWLADHILPARILLALLGFGMAAMAFVVGQFAPGWSYAAVLVAEIATGATASGFTGITYGELARLGGARRTEATGLGSGVLFAGSTVAPAVFGVAVKTLGGYEIAYAGIGLLAAAAGLNLLRPVSR